MDLQLNSVANLDSINTLGLLDMMIFVLTFFFFNMEINLSQPSTWDMAEENTGGKKIPILRIPTSTLVNNEGHISILEVPIVCMLHTEL